MNIEQVTERLSALNNKDTLSDEERKQKGSLELDLHLENNKMRNRQITGDTFDKFMERDITIERFLTISNVEHMLVTAPTQVGKTDNVIKIVENCIKKNTAVIISSDNKTDQQDQIYSRLSRSLTAVTAILLRNSNKLEKNISSTVSTPVVFCLDNVTQVNNVRRQMMDCMIERQKIVIIHDEGDVVTKCGEGYIDTENSSKSHAAWVRLIDNYKKIGVEVKRIFVTATPLNCLSHYPIRAEFIVNISPPNSYTGFESINYAGNIGDLNWQAMLSHKFSAVLYVTDRKTDNHKDMLENFANLHNTVFCHTYNGKGITYNKVYSRMTRFLEKKGFTVKVGKNDVTVSISISDLYTICKHIKFRNVVTIGMDLICRGISFVGKQKVEPITANVMVYLPGKTLHNVGINQTIGRLCGNARPDLQRMIYCEEEVYNSYMSYNRNIRYVLDNIMGDSDQWVAENEILPDNGRALDRPIVKLHQKYTSSPEETDETDETYNNDEGTIDGVQIRLLRKWCTEKNATVPSRIIYHLLGCENYRDTCDNIIQKCSLRHDGLSDCRTVKSDHGKLTCIKSDKASLNPNLIDYIRQYTGL